MAEKYRLDRTVFFASKAEESNSDYIYWEKRTAKDRLLAGCYLIAAAYDFDVINPPKMDKSHFEAFKR